MASWEDLQRSYSQQETAWENYFHDLQKKAAAAMDAFKDFLGITDNVLPRDGQDAKRKVVLCKLADGRWRECRHPELSGKGRQVDFGIGVTTMYEGRVRLTVAELSVEHRDGAYVFQLSDPSEKISAKRCAEHGDFSDLSDALYQRFVKIFADRP